MQTRNHPNSLHLFMSSANHSVSAKHFPPTATEIDNSSATPDNVAAPFSTEHNKPASNESQKSATDFNFCKGAYSMSDTIFQTMLRSSSSQLPEDDINDESSTGIVIYSGGTSEPDPSARANTYYTP